MQAAADYSDHWFKKNEKAFKVYYVCLAGHAGYGCYKITLIQKWERLHDTPGTVSREFFVA